MSGWKVRTANHCLVIEDEQGRAIGVTYGFEYDANKANAHLWAAAPELLAAAREAEEFLSGLLPDDDDAEDCERIRSNLLDAIAKATVAP